MITNDFLQFLHDLDMNNNKVWFDSQKKRFEQQVKEPFTLLIADLIASLQTVDPEILVEPKDTVFRIFKDTRFSKDKTPYKTHMSAVISKYGRKDPSWPGYYIHADYKQFMFGGGAYFLEKEPLERVRLSIMTQPDRFKAIINNSSFISHFGGLKGEKNKRLVPEFAAVQSTIPEIANKQFYFMAEMPAETILRPDLTTLLTTMASSAKPLNEFLKEALGK